MSKKHGILISVVTLISLFISLKLYNYLGITESAHKVALTYMFLIEAIVIWYLYENDWLRSISSPGLKLLLLLLALLYMTSGTVMPIALVTEQISVMAYAWHVVVVLGITGYFFFKEPNSIDLSQSSKVGNY